MKDFNPILIICIVFAAILAGVFYLRFWFNKPDIVIKDCFVTGEIGGIAISEEENMDKWRIEGNVFIGDGVSVIRIK